MLANDLTDTDEIRRLANGVHALRLVRRLIEEGNKMPEAGGKKLATDFGSMMADVRKSIDAAKTSVQEAVRELKTEITSGATKVAKALRVEATAVRDGYAQLLGNAEQEVAPETTQTAADAAKPQGTPVAATADTAPTASPQPGQGVQAKPATFP